MIVTMTNQSNENKLAVAPQLRRDETAKFRNDCKRNASQFGLLRKNNDVGMRFCVADHKSTVHDKQAFDLFKQNLGHLEMELIAAAIEGTSFTDEAANSYKFSRSFIAMFLSKENKLLAAAIVVEKHTNTKPGNRNKTMEQSVVHEIVFFAMDKTQQSAQGLDALFFANIHQLASCLGVFALVVVSTIDMLTWWISRPGVHICSTVLGSVS